MTGFDLFTVEEVPRSDQSLFDHNINEGKGCFFHTNRVTSILSHLGVDLDSTMNRKLHGHQQTMRDIPLWRAMSVNMGYQVTPEECELIHSLLTQKELLRQALEQEDGAKNDPETVKFYLKFAEFCKAASLYGGFYVC